MGVPKFYRWISERYPCLSETVKEFQIPEFDNLYLDMNGIIHVCSHPEDDNPHFRITEEKIFSDIMHYLEFLFRMIKPRKVFFMAVDGVAPRAKMNQQRGRRFRSAREAEELERKAKEKGETLPTEKRFDSNCITPGTPFMVRLQEQLKYFVVKKLSTDPLWHGVRVYLSGHETPGEGEHKIMDFIRHERSQTGYDPNTRHCLYGLDADLMMLGLATHDPHFSLLREEVRFGGKKDKHKRPTTAEETTFHLLHLSLFREYLDFEFSALKESLPFPYNLESVIDDWVLMGFLVGNDFIPHLPNLHINHDALPLLWKTYIDVLPSCGGYINEGGYLNLERFEKYIVALSQFDFDTFSEQAGDLKWLEGKKAQSDADKAELISAARKFRKNMKKEENRFAAFANNSEDLEDFMGEEKIDESYDLSPEEISEEILSDEDSGDTLGDEFRHHKRYYYMTKMDYQKVTPEVLKDQAEGYVRGLQWILLYYYEGVPSWSWFYPHHYAPYMSDVKDFKNMNITFDLGTPFLPFEQLMAVLPAASKELLPPPFQTLMTMDSSPVIDFYPLNFDTDLNGKQQDWEAVVLIPFIDENRLLTAMKTKESLLSADEKSRNCHGPCLLYEYNQEPSGVYPSSLPDAFPDIAINHSKLTKIAKDGLILPSHKLVKGLLPGVKLDVYYAGFPTLKHIPHSAELKKEGVKVFQMNSRGFNVMLNIKEQDTPDIRQVAKDYLGREIFVGWPHLYEAKVIAVCDDITNYSLVETKETKGKKSSQPEKRQLKKDDNDENTTNTWYREVHSIKEKYKDRLGINIGDTDILIRALPMTGRKYVFGSHGRVTLEKQFGNRPVPFALQATVKDIAVHDSSFCQFKTLKEYLPESSPVFMLGWPHYGCQGEVLEVDHDSGRVRINLSIFEEPKLTSIINNQTLHAERYMLGFVAAQRLGISSNILSRITGTILVGAGEQELAEQQQNPHKVNIGLNLKFTKKGEEVPGYTKMSDGQWTYSQKVVDLVTEYLQKFPEMFDNICKSNNKGNDIFYESQLIPSSCSYNLKDVSDYIKSLPCSSIKPMKSGADIISEGTISALQDEAKRVVEINKKRQKRVKMQVKPHLLFRHVSTGGAIIPDSTTMYQLFDRVVNIRQGYAVPFGLRGTVVGIHPADVEVNTVYEVIFDEEFMGGISISCDIEQGYAGPFGLRGTVVRIHPADVEVNTVYEVIFDEEFMGGISIRQGYAVPFGLRGTVVGIHPANVEVNTVYEVIFDEEFMGGISIRQGYAEPFGLRGTVVGIHPADVEVNTVYEVIFDEEFMGGISIRQGYAVPFGLRGTVVGIHPADVEVNTVYEVIFDEEFIGGISIRDSSNRGYRMPPSSLLNLTHGERKNGVKPAITQPDLNSQPYGAQQNRNTAGNRNYSEVAGYGRGNQYNQGYDARNQTGYGGYQDNRGGYYDNQGGRRGQDDRHKNPWTPQQGSSRSGQESHTPLRKNENRVNRNSQPPESKEDLSGKIFNGGSSSGSQPTFVTPKLSRSNSGTYRPDTLPLNTHNKPQEKQASDEFSNMWKQLQSASDSGEGTSLSQAAAVLPKVTKPDANNSNMTKLDVDSLFSQASQSMSTDQSESNKSMAQSNSGAKDKKDAKPSTKVVSNDEFAAMFKSLEAGQAKHDEEMEDKQDEDESADMIKKMLHIGDQTHEDPDHTAQDGAQKVSYGRQVSLQELFDGAKQQKGPADKSQSTTEPQQQQQKRGAKQKQGPSDKSQSQSTTDSQQQQQKLSKAGSSNKQKQQQGQQPSTGLHPPPLMQQQVHPSLQQRPPLMMSPNQGGNRNPVMELMSFCQSLQIGIPIYDYIPKGGLHYSVVTMQNGARYQGSLCRTREEAAESAAGVALLQMKGSMHQMPVHPIMRQPGYTPGVMLPQGRQFSSPNSAFSPVSNFAGFQGPMIPGQYGGYNQRSYHQGHQGQRGGAPRQQYLQNNSYYGNSGQQNYQNQGRHQNHQNYNNNNNNNNNSGNSKSNQNTRQTEKPADSQQTVPDVTSTNQKAKIGLTNQNEGKTKPTSVVTPFVPLQVTKKQTPQKQRKESTSDDTTTKSGSEHSPPTNSKMSPSNFSEHLTENSENVGSDKQTSDNKNAEKIMDTDKTPQKDLAENLKEKTPAKKTEPKTPGSGKKPKRRLAANFNFNN